MVPEFLLAYSCYINNIPNACAGVLASYLSYNKDLKSVIEFNERRINTYISRYPVLIYVATPIYQSVSGQPISFSISSSSSISIDTRRNLISINFAF